MKCFAASFPQTISLLSVFEGILRDTGWEAKTQGVFARCVQIRAHPDARNSKTGLIVHKPISKYTRTHEDDYEM